MAHAGTCLAGALLLCGALGGSRPACAHPMGNFAICHYAHLTPGAGSLKIRYVLDFAEIPTVAEKQDIDQSHDGRITDAAWSAYLKRKIPTLIHGLEITVDGRPVVPTCTHSAYGLFPGAAGLQTMKIRLDLSAPLPVPGVSGPARSEIDYRDDNYPERTGWREVVASTAAGGPLPDSTAPATDRSHELTLYPVGAIPPQVTEASFTLTPAAITAAATTAPAADPLTAGIAGPAIAPAAVAAVAATPRDRFTETIREARLTPAFVALGVLIAFIYGGFHALSPGHGKTMVAAYLVGSRGTARHAMLLGTTVTLTHTLGVFALGLLTLFASRYIVPERLYPILSVSSGMLVAAVGAQLFLSRIRRLRAAGAASAAHAHVHDHDHVHENDHVHPHEHSHDHDHLHMDAHEHTHPHDHDHDHAHDHDHVHPQDHNHDHGMDAHGGHDHGLGYHTHGVPEGPVTVRSLIALGVSGGLVPCPSALVVLLSAIALHRLVFGLVLITAFSAGLAAVLIALGLAAVSAGGWISRRAADDRWRGRASATGSWLLPLLQRLPIASAAAVFVIGCVLIARTFVPGIGAP